MQVHVSAIVSVWAILPEMSADIGKESTHTEGITITLQRMNYGTLFTGARVTGRVIWQLVQLLDELKHIVWQPFHRRGWL
jgi:hypothetical protein